MRMDLGTRNTLLYDFMHGMTAVSLEMSDEPIFISSKSVWVRIERMVGFAEVSNHEFISCNCFCILNEFSDCLLSFYNGKWVILSTNISHFVMSN